MKKKNSITIAIILLLIVYYFINKTWGFSIPCIFHKITGFYCPGCGVTRLLFSLLKLDFYQAFRYNPLIFVLLIGYIIYKLINLKFDIKLTKNTTYILLFVVILFGIVRNIDIFSYLKPTIIN